MPPTLAAALLLLLLPCTSAQPLPLGALLALRGGLASDGELSVSAAPQFLDVLSPATGALLRTIPLPATGDAAVLAYLSNSEGTITTFGNGAGLVVTGYATSVGTPYPSSEPWDKVGRAIATIDCNGTVSVDAVLRGGVPGDGNLRSAATYDGSYFYLSTEQQGILFTRRGGGSVALNATRLDAAVALAGPRSAAVVWDASSSRYQLMITSSNAALRGIVALGAGTPFAMDSSAPPRLISMDSGTPHQFVFESATKLWVAEAGLGQWSAPSAAGPWSKVGATIATLPASDGSAPGLRGLIGRVEGGGVFVLYATPTDELGVLAPRVLRYTTSGAAQGWSLIATSPAVTSPYRGVAFVPACSALAPPAGGAPPTPLPTPALPSPLPPAGVTSLLSSVATLLEGARMNITLRVSAPSVLDYLGVWADAASDPLAVAPMRLVALAALPASAYAAEGAASVRLRLLAMTGGVLLAVVRLPDGVPSIDAWLQAGAQLLPGPRLALPLGAPAAPLRTRATPGDAAGSMRVSWTSIARAQRPQLSWTHPLTLVKTAVSALEASVTRAAMCPDYLPDLRSLPRAEGWAELGWHYTANVSGLPLGADVSYEVGDAMVPGATSPPASLYIAPASTERAGAPLSLLVVADAGIGTDDDSIAFSNRGEASRAGYARMAAEVSASRARGGPRHAALLMSGDLSYSDGLLTAVAEFADSLTPLTSVMPMAWGVGNHEASFVRALWSLCARCKEPRCAP